MSEPSTANEPSRILGVLKPVTDGLGPFMEPLLRLVAGGFLIPHGAGKLFGGLEGTAQFFGQVGYEPAFLLALLVALVEFFGGIMLAVGLLTRPVALAVLIFMLNAVAFHAGNGFMWNNGGYEYPLMWAVVALFFLVRGGGAYSIDRLIGREF